MTWHCLIKIYILIEEGISQKKILGVSRLWVSRRKELLLGAYDLKNNEKNNSRGKGLKAALLNLVKKKSVQHTWISWLDRFVPGSLTGIKLPFLAINCLLFLDYFFIIFDHFIFFVLNNLAFVRQTARQKSINIFWKKDKFWVCVCVYIYIYTYIPL